MKDIRRDDIHILDRHSKLTREGIDKTLKENIYNDKEAWQKFFKLLFISLGLGFSLSGVIFFFAYNWADLHKFAKIGLIEGLLIATTLLILLLKINEITRNILLSGASVLVGVLFAVFGQVYQTGANAYDFFLAWTASISLWVFVSNFAPLWLFYLLLINTTIFLYSYQVAREWSGLFVHTLLFIINALVLIATTWLSKYKTSCVPKWFLNTVALASATLASIGLIAGIFDNYQESFFTLLLITMVVYSLGIWQGLREKSVFYLSVIPFSIIIVVSAFLSKNSEGESMLLVISLFIPISVTLVIKNLIAIQKKWKNEK